MTILETLLIMAYNVGREHGEKNTDKMRKGRHRLPFGEQTSRRRR